ncbi:MAG: hypothetical protein CM1200mP27_10350 [Chloroflexota bacterium]|nr:MAG: hypothetical protein CM1200mP27_10350 [Chloroflexota bacterium]
MAPISVYLGFFTEGTEKPSFPCQDKIYRRLQSPGIAGVKAFVTLMICLYCGADRGRARRISVNPNSLEQRDGQGKVLYKGHAVAAWLRSVQRQSMPFTNRRRLRNINPVLDGRELWSKFALLPHRFSVQKESSFVQGAFVMTTMRVHDQRSKPFVFDLGM